MYSQLQSSTRMIHHMNQNVTMLYYKGYAGIANGDHFEQVLCDRYQGHVPSFCGTSQLVAISNSPCSFCRKKSFKEESRKSAPIVIHINIHPNCYYSNLFVVNQLSFVLLREQYMLVYSLMLLDLFLLICTSIPLVVSLWMKRKNWFVRVALWIVRWIKLYPVSIHCIRIHYWDGDWFVVSWGIVFESPSSWLVMIHRRWTMFILVWMQWISMRMIY